MTIEQRYSMLTLDKCSGISGYYRDETMIESEKFTIGKNSQEYEMMCDLIYKKEYRRSIYDLLPRGTRIHREEPGDFQWEVYFYFKDIEFPDGSMGAGAMLHIQNWYGDLDIYFDGERLTCYTDEQESWVKEVFDIIR